MNGHTIGFGGHMMQIDCNFSCDASYTDDLNSLSPEMKLLVPLTVFHTFLMELSHGELFCLIIKSSYPW